ncbi:hypothetical protein TELCIR_08884 [Teladorsagia circumcincta]|uniref:Uncharacterized protein n=1 Tax=Teladorsagia circumcincta TaxID=45464 RepID=A0A2G9UGD6_TELCI|nr:hypothetical protein TELCIR_08884 [Teladorsagia circumcincta]
MMTPSSIGSNHLEAAPFLFDEDHLWDSASPAGNLDKFPFSRGKKAYVHLKVKPVFEGWGNLLKSLWV